MKQTFTAKSVVTENSPEEESFIVGFMDNEKDPSEFALFQRAFEFDDQDEETGLAGHWFEYKDQAYGDYKACESVTILKDVIKIKISENSKNIFSEFSGFEIHFNISNEELKFMIETMKSIFQDNPEILRIED
ncbi:MAG: hypothetical protein H7256_15225 [Bdellovibrio sp.]|nr:hypothetical protein [Bdellovibrio sp.]